MSRFVAVVAVLLVLAPAGAQDGPKRELKYRFAKGETFPMKIDYRMSVKLHKIPDLFQGVMGEDPMDLKLEALLDASVKEVGADGAAHLEGAWKSLKVKGHVMVNDIDFAHPPAKDAKPAPKPDPALEGDLQGLMNMEDNLRKLVAGPLQLKVDPQGRIAVVGDAAQLEGPFRTLGGLTGSLPRGPVGPGDAWKDETKIQIPAGASTMDVKIGIESKLEGTAPVDGRACARVKSKFAVGSPEGFAQDDPNNPLQLKIKTEGEGEGTLHFAYEEGRLAKAQSSLKIKVSVAFPNPGGGEEIELGGTVKIDQTNEMGGR
jgi:hypothetical protein